MFDFDLELKKFKPAVGVEIGEDELFSDDVKDITESCRRTGIRA